jgi:hypothetical protein
VTAFLIASSEFDNNGTPHTELVLRLKPEVFMHKENDLPRRGGSCVKVRRRGWVRLENGKD